MSVIEGVLEDDALRGFLERSRPHVSRVAEQFAKDDGGNPYKASLWQALEAITAGDWLLARDRLRLVKVNHFRQIDEEPTEFLAAAIYCLQFDVAQSLCRKIFPGLARTSFFVSASDSERFLRYPGVTRWEIHGSGQASLYLSPTFWDIGCYLALQRLISYFPVISEFNASTNRNAGHLHLNTGDHAFGPGLASSAPTGQFFLVPDPDYISSKGYLNISESFSANLIPFYDRKPVAFWRGGTQGHSNSGWTGVPRIRMCKLATESSNVDIMDFKLVYIVHSEALPIEERDLVLNSGLMGDFVPATKLVEYKYHVDIDGHSNAWTALFLKLLTGSPVIKVSSIYRQWYYDRLEPWVNYVPAAPDLSDLEEKIIWLRENEAEAELIGRRGRELAMSLDYSSQVRAMMVTIDKAMEATVTAK